MLKGQSWEAGSTAGGTWCVFRASHGQSGCLCRLLETLWALRALRLRLWRLCDGPGEWLCVGVLLRCLLVSRGCPRLAAFVPATSQQGRPCCGRGRQVAGRQVAPRRGRTPPVREHSCECRLLADLNPSGLLSALRAYVDVSSAVPRHLQVHLFSDTHAGMHI